MASMPVKTANRAVAVKMGYGDNIEQEMLSS
jgi:hypothetical protein